jgi:microcystin-dependent protein
MDDWVVGYPINFTAQGDMTKDAIKQACIQEVSKIYAHLNLIRSKFESDASIKIIDDITSTGDLPATGTVGDAYNVSTEEGNTLYAWDGATWVELTTEPFPAMSDTEYGLARKGTLQNMLDKASSDVAAVTEVLLRDFGYEAGLDVPAGTIVPWWGDVTMIPTGWAFCDGTNGTLDLRGKFMRGAEDGEELKEGGADEITIQESTLLSHTHELTATDGSYKHTHKMQATLGSEKTPHIHQARFTTLGMTPSAEHTHTSDNVLYAGAAWNSGRRGGTIVYITVDYVYRHFNYVGESPAHTHSVTYGAGLRVNSFSHKHDINTETDMSADYNTSILGTTEVASKVDPKTYSNKPVHMELVYIQKL